MLSVLSTSFWEHLTFNIFGMSCFFTEIVVPPCLCHGMIYMLLCHFTEFWMIIISLHFWVYSMVSFIDVALYKILAWLFCCIFMNSLKLPIKVRNLLDFSCVSPDHTFLAETQLYVTSHQFMAWTQLLCHRIIFLCHCKNRLIARTFSV